jgi:phthalate 4,5-cis-dihydrodiol dehydrogenase
MSSAPIRLGVAGLGRAFTLMLPTFLHDSRIQLVAAADPIAAAREQFKADFNAPAYASVEALCANADVAAIYIASPHAFHADQVCLAAAHGKHVLVEKPMALTLDECTRMIEACQSAGVHLVVGHSHSFDAPIQRAKQIIDSGKYGAVRMLTAQNFTDFLYRPRRPEELATQLGGGVMHSQAAHQIDMVRLLGGGLVSSVRAHTGAWDSSRSTEGAYSALLGFEGGAFASCTYSGYGHYDTDALMDNIGELGQRKNPEDYAVARKRLLNAIKPEEETALKADRNYGGKLYLPALGLPTGLAHQHFGQIIISCEKADLRPSPTGIAVYADKQKSFELLPAPRIPRQEVIDELFDAVVHGKPAPHCGGWARATTAACLAMLESAQSGQDCRPAFQVSYPVNI